MVGTEGVGGRKEGGRQEGSYGIKSAFHVLQGRETVARRPTLDVFQ